MFPYSYLNDHSIRPEDLIETAVSALKNRDYLDAMECCERAIRNMKPDSPPDIMHRIAAILNECRSGISVQGRDLAELTRPVLRNRKDYGNMTKLAEISAKVGNWDYALELYSCADLSEAPLIMKQANEIDVARCYFKTGNFAASIFFYLRSLMFGDYKPHPPALEGLMLAYTATGRKVEAERIARIYLRHYDDIPNFHATYLGQIGIDVAQLEPANEQARDEFVGSMKSDMRKLFE